MMILPKTISLILKFLENSGYEAVVVGGAVRDYLLGKTPNDYDISTNARPEEIKKVFHRYHTLDIGIKHGTVTVFINSRQVDITTYRSEKDYEDFRHPKEVVFETSLEEDLKRRDFTINAICFNRILIDHVDGIKDLNKKIIRAIGDPKERFSEDPLRILRALRFAAILDFKIEEITRKAIFEEAELLRMVSSERINLELSKLLLGQAAIRVIREYSHVFKVFIPELLSDLDFNLNVLEKVDNLPTKLAAFLYTIPAEVASEILKRLKYSKNQIAGVVFLLENETLILKPDMKEIGKLLKNYDLNDLKMLAKFQIALSFALKKDDSNLKEVLEILNKVDLHKCYRLKDLAVSGRDLLKLGFEEGVKIRILLDKLLDLVIEGSLENEKTELLDYLKKNFLNNMK